MATRPSLKPLVAACSHTTFLHQPFNLGMLSTNSRYLHAVDIKAGKLDVYGQLGPNYVQQGAPHMRAIGRMVKRLLGHADANAWDARANANATVF